MGTAIAKAGSTAVSNEAFNPWAEEGKDSGGGFRGQFAKFSGKTGEYSYGQDDEEIEPGTQVIVDFDLITKGYNCWVDEQVVDRAFVRIASGETIDKSELADHGPYEKHDDGSEDGWQEVHCLPFIIDDEDDDNAYLLQLSSGGGVRAMKSLYRSYGKTFQSKIDDDGNYMLPVIELDVESYKSKRKRVGTVYNPVFKIVDWLTRDEVGERLAILMNAAGDAEESAADEEDDDAPKGRRRAAREEEEEEAPKARRSSRKAKDEDEDAPKGRRQRSKPEEEDEEIQPEDHGEEESEAEEEEEQDEAPRRGRRRAADSDEDEAPKGKDTGRASGRRSRRF